MWGRFTERARRVVLSAQEEAMQMGSDYVGTEHLLLGLLNEAEGTGAQVLQKMGISLEQVRPQIAPVEKPLTKPQRLAQMLSLAEQEEIGAQFKVPPELVRQVEEGILRKLGQQHSKSKREPEPKLTSKARRALELAVSEASRMRHNYIGTEHLLLGLLHNHNEDEAAARILNQLGLTLEQARAQVVEYLGAKRDEPDIRPGNESPG